jgi:hypothetical protein
MSDKSTIMKTFNTQLFDFLDDIIRIFPENNDIAAARKSFELIKRANPTAIIKVWATHVYLPYKDVIDAGDIEFFFNKDYGSDLGQLSNSSEIIKIIDTLRDPVKSMSDNNRAHTMKYIQILSKLSNLYG